MELKFAPSDEVDSRCYDLIAKLYPTCRAWLSNESSFWDFPSDPRDETSRRDEPAYRLIPYAEVPPEDRSFYEHEMRQPGDGGPSVRGGGVQHPSLPRGYVVYPPYTEEKRQENLRVFRAELVAKIRAIYDVDLTEDLADDQCLKIARIARLIDAHLLRGWNDCEAKLG